MHGHDVEKGADGKKIDGAAFAGCVPTHIKRQSTARSPLRFDWSDSDVLLVVRRLATGLRVHVRDLSPVLHNITTVAPPHCSFRSIKLTMKTVITLLSLLIASAAAFGPSLFGVQTQSSR